MPRNLTYNKVLHCSLVDAQELLKNYQLSYLENKKLSPVMNAIMGH